MKVKSKLGNKNFIPVSEPLITKDDIKAVLKLSNLAGYHLLAKKLKILKEIFLDFRSKLCNHSFEWNCALEIALKAVGVKKMMK